MCPNHFVSASTLALIRFLEPRRLSLVYLFSKNIDSASLPVDFKIFRVLHIRRLAMPKLGGACRDRTDDPLLAKQVLYQLS